MKWRQFILSIDFAFAVIVTASVGYFIPATIKYDFTTSFYNVGITVLSIVFSLFFASLAILMSLSDSEFIDFLEEKEHYSTLIFTYKFTLVCLFFSLGYSIVLYAFADYWVKHHPKNCLHNNWFFLGFVFVFTYSLTATALCIKDAIKFSKYRLDFLKQKKK